MQSDEYNFNVHTEVGTKLPFWQYYDYVALVPMDDPTRTGYIAHQSRFLRWLFPRQYGLNQVDKMWFKID